MIISQTAEYALRAVVLLADSDGTAMTTQQIAEASKVPADYLSKILQNLRRAGLVIAQRGLYGGFVLSRPASDVTLLEVVNAIDPIQRITTCPLKLKSHGVNLCPLHKKLDQAIASVEKGLSTSTLQGLLRSPATSRPLCEG
jgi:Rrf2 family protein